MQDHVQHAEATAIVKLGDTEMNIGDLISLQVGDIIPLSQEVSGELDLQIEDAKKMKCLIGVYKGNRAVQITRRIT